MRTKSIEVEGFRAFTNKHQFDLDADAVVIQGSNGQGKTSLFDSFLWCLTGSIPRLEKKQEKRKDETQRDQAETVISRYSRTGVARVSLTLASATGAEYQVTRAVDGSGQRVSLDSGKADDRLTGAAAEQAIRTLIWPDSEITSDPASSVSRALTRCVYLQQDRLRDFIEADSDDERFSAVSELLGVGRLTDLRNALDRERRRWSRSLSEVESSIAETQSNIQEVKNKLSDLESTRERQIGPGDWDLWWKSVTPWISVDLYAPVDSPSAADSLDSAIRSLHDHQRKLKRRRIQLQRLDSELKSDRRVKAPDELSAQAAQFKERLKELQLRLDAADKDLKRAQEEASRRVQELVAQRVQREQMAGLAEIALLLLDDTCPVCTQSIDRKQVEVRLRKILEGPTEVAPRAADGSQVEAVSRARREVADEVHTLERALTSIQESLDRHREWEEGISETLEALGLNPRPFSELESLVARELSRAEQEEVSLKDIQASGESLATAQARRAQEASRRGEQSRLNDLESKLARLRATYQRRRKTGDLATSILENLRNAEAEFVQKRLDDMAPLLRRVFARMDPHPSFRDVALSVHMYYGKGRLSATIRDHLRNLDAEHPEFILSSSQVNVLALSIFLSFNLGVPTIPVSCTLLDDPVQSLDDVNLLGLSDLLRRLKQKRQVIVSTHDETLARLLMRKLRPINSRDRTIVHRLQGWSRVGPSVETLEIPHGDARLRVVA